MVAIARVVREKWRLRVKLFAHFPQTTHALERVENSVKKHESNNRDYSADHRRLQLRTRQLLRNRHLLLHRHPRVKKEHVNKHENANSAQVGIQVLPWFFLGYGGEKLVKPLRIPQERTKILNFSHHTVFLFVTLYFIQYFNKLLTCNARVCSVNLT